MLTFHLLFFSTIFKSEIGSQLFCFCTYQVSIKFMCIWIEKPCIFQNRLEQCQNYLEFFFFAFPFLKQRHNSCTIKFLIFFFLMLAIQLWNYLILIFFKSCIYQLLNFIYVYLYITFFFFLGSFEHLYFISKSSYIRYTCHRAACNCFNFLDLYYF